MIGFWLVLLGGLWLLGDNPVAFIFVSPVWLMLLHITWNPRPKPVTVITVTRPLTDEELEMTDEEILRGRRRGWRWWLWHG